MNNKLSNLTVNILTYKTNKEILKNCINSISKSVLINIVENSNKFEDAENFKKLDQVFFKILNTNFILENQK